LRAKTRIRRGWRAYSGGPSVSYAGATYGGEEACKRGEKTERVAFFDVPRYDRGMAGAQQNARRPPKAGKPQGARGLLERWGNESPKKHNTPQTKLDGAHKAFQARLAGSTKKSLRKETTSGRGRGTANVPL